MAIFFLYRQATQLLQISLRSITSQSCLIVAQIPLKLSVCPERNL
jgi:hypothetical protein